MSVSPKKPQIVITIHRDDLLSMFIRQRNTDGKLELTSSLISDTSQETLDSITKVASNAVKEALADLYLGD